MAPSRTSGKAAGQKPTAWLLLLLLPYAGLLFPAIYARQTPALFGFPFFYWYQFAWVIAASLIMGIVYAKTRDRRDR